MRTLCLRGDEIETKEALHEKLTEELDFPSWYGGNLDALYDCLTDYDEELELSVVNAASLEAALGNYAGRFLQVLEDAAMENDCLRISIE